MARILLVEDEESLARGLFDVLEAKGHDPEWVQEGPKALQRAREGNFDLVLLDLEIPGLSGFEVLKSLREEGSQTRVMILSARQEELDRVRAFELGGDDYLSKPFSLSELLGRIAALLRRSPQFSVSSEKEQVIGCARFDFAQYRAYRDKEELKLPQKGFILLRYLLDRKGQAVKRDDLMDAVWGQGEFVAQRTLNNLVVKLRQAIEAAPDKPQRLKTVHGLGYRLDL